MANFIPVGILNGNITKYSMNDVIDTDGISINTSNGDILTSGGNIETSGGNLCTGGAAIFTSNGCIDTGAGNILSHGNIDLYNTGCIINVNMSSTPNDNDVVNVKFVNTCLTNCLGNSHLDDTANASSNILWSSEIINNCINSAINGLSWQEEIIDFYDPNPNLPSSPNDGDRYIALSTYNNWTINNIYTYDSGSGSWIEHVTQVNDTVWNTTLQKNYTFNGSNWVLVGTTIDHQNLSNLLGGNTTERYHLDNTQYNVLINAVTNTFDSNSKIIGTQTIFTPTSSISSTDLESAINELDNNKINKDDTATSGNIACFDSNGEVKDSGLRFTSVNNHITCQEIHRVINDTGTSTTDLWSANKINNKLSTLNTLITNNTNNMFKHDGSVGASGTFCMFGNDIDMCGGSILNLANNSIHFVDGSKISSDKFDNNGNITACIADNAMCLNGKSISYFMCASRITYGTTLPDPSTMNEGDIFICL